MNKLIDVFLYSGAHEHDLVRLRYMTLKNHVDKMIAVSCNLTYQGEPSPMEPPPEDLNDLSWMTVIANEFPDDEKSKWGGKNWGHVEYQHRNEIPKMLSAAGYDNNDIIILSDFDEIPDPKFLNEIVGAVNMFGWCSIPMRMHGFALDYLYPTQLLFSTVSKLKDMKPQDQRNTRYGAMRAGWGWHLSWLGDINAKKRKRDWFSHGELDDLDVENCWRDAKHANGEDLIILNKDQVSNLSWPKPIINDEFSVPQEWWSPNWQTT